MCERLFTLLLLLQNTTLVTYMTTVD